MPNAPASNGRAAGGQHGERVLVIGCGFIGSHVVLELAARERPPVVLTRSRPAQEVEAMLAQGRLHLGDAADRDAVEAALEGVDRVVFAAGGLLPAASEQDPERDAELTLAPLRTVLDALRSRSEVRFIYVSSGGTVYGDPETLPVDEEAPTRPIGAYGRLHVVCEEEIERHRHRHGLRTRILRCSTVYGERQEPDRGQGAIVTFLHRIEHGEPIHLYGGGSTVRDYVYAGDVARVIVELLGRDDGPPILNVGSARGISLDDLLRLAEDEVGRRATVIRHEKRGFDVARIVLDTTRLRSLVDFEPMPLEAGMARTHRWLLEAAAERV